MIKVVAALLAVAFALFSGISANDPDKLQDVCVADLSSEIKVNGFPCKKSFTADDFFFAGLVNPGPTDNMLGLAVTHADVEKFPGLNTLGISLERIDFAPGGLNPPHTHPRATEIIFVLYGELYVRFITTGNVTVSKSIKKGEVFLFPKGLLHFQKNNGYSPASAISAFNSQLPGHLHIVEALLTLVADDVLAKEFQIGTKEVQKIIAKLAPK